VIRSPRCIGNIRLVALLVLGWLRVRRGDPGASDLIDEALALARSSQHLQRLWPVAACRAEHAWTRGRLAEELSLVEEVLALAQRLGYRPAIEELNHWLTIGDGHARGRVDEVRTAFGLSAAGHPDLAAVRWRELGCPYERAVANYLVGTRDSVADAHATLIDLGAAPMRDLAAGALRDLGARVPRGQNRSTRANPYGLTDRELEVLALLPSGMTNAEIGKELFISTKTAGNHVSNLLAKLSVSTRAEAAVIASRLDAT
jgi:DNA-binding CsgD family transcriptional regulator